MKKIVIMCAIALSTQFVSAQSEQFKKDAITYVETAGIKEQMKPIKEQFLSAILPENLDAYVKDFDGAVDGFIKSFSELITANYKEADLKEALKTYESTKEFAALPALDNDAEINTKLQELQGKMMMDLQSVVIKYADPSKLNQQ